MLGPVFLSSGSLPFTTVDQLCLSILSNNLFPISWLVLASKLTLAAVLAGGFSRILVCFNNLSMPGLSPRSHALSKAGCITGSI